MEGLETSGFFPLIIHKCPDTSKYYLSDKNQDLNQLTCCDKGEKTILCEGFIWSYVIPKLGCWNTVHAYILFCYFFVAKLLVRIASIYSWTINIWEVLSINSHPDFCHFNRSTLTSFYNDYWGVVHLFTYWWILVQSFSRIIHSN